MNWFENKKRIGIFGPSESGKTTLAKKIAAEFFIKEGRWAIVLDPIERGDWGDHARVFQDEAQFLCYIQTVRDCLVIVDDGSVTIARDAEKNFIFTTLRHQGHKLLVIGHNATDLMPAQRRQLQLLFLFRQNAEAIKTLEGDFCGQDFSAAERLRQYEFLVADSWTVPKIYQLTKP